MTHNSIQSLAGLFAWRLNLDCCPITLNSISIFFSVSFQIHQFRRELMLGRIEPHSNFCGFDVFFLSKLMEVVSESIGSRQKLVASMSVSVIGNQMKWNSNECQTWLWYYENKVQNWFMKRQTVFNSSQKLALDNFANLFQMFLCWHLWDSLIYCVVPPS